MLRLQFSVLLIVQSSQRDVGSPHVHLSRCKSYHRRFVMQISGVTMILVGVLAR